MRRVVTWARAAGVAAALIVGCLGSAAAVRVSGFPGPPAESAAVDAAVTAIGQRPVDTPGPVVVCDYWCPEYHGDNVVSYDSPADRTDAVAVTYDLPGARAADVEAAARQRLAAAGWLSGAGGELTRDGLAVVLQIADTAAGVDATVVATKSTSLLAVVLAALGFAVGAALGWLLAGWASRRFQRHGPAVRLFAGVFAVLVIAVTMGYATTVGMLLVNARAAEADVQLAEFVLTVFPALSTTVLGMALAALLLIALPPRRGGLRMRFGPPVRHTGDHGAARS